MDWMIPLTGIGFVASTVLAVGVVIQTWPRRRMPGGRSLLAMMAAVAVWATFAALELVVPSIPANILLSKLSYFGVVGAPLAYLVFTLAVTNPGRPVARSTVTALCAPGMLVLLAVFTNEWHRLVWVDVRLDPRIGLPVYAHGPVYYAASGYLAAMALAASVMNVAEAWRLPPPYRLQARAAMAAAILPLLTASLYIAGASPVPGIDLTPGALAASGGLFSLGLTRFRMLDLVPIAKSVVFDRLADGILVIDDRSRVLDANQAARALLQTECPEIGSELPPTVAGWLAAAAQVSIDGTAVRIVHHGSVDLHVSVSRLPHRSESTGGLVVILRDITTEREAERALFKVQDALEERVEELQATLSHVHTLQGLLPICAYCKRIRSDENYWQQIESYFITHSDVKFSHGICPECFERVARELEDPGADAGQLPPPPPRQS